MRRLLAALALLATALWSAPCLAQARSQLGPLCTTDTTPAAQQIDACNKIIALKVFKGEQLATVYFWRAVGWNKKGDYIKVIADATEAVKLQPSQAVYNLRGSAYFDKGEYDIAIADFDDALKLGGAERDHLPQPRQRLSGQEGLRSRDRRFRRRDQGRPEIGVLLPEPRQLQGGARRSRRRARRHQPGDPARSEPVAAAGAPDHDLARQGRARSRHCRRQRGDPACEGQAAGQHHDSAEQRADLGLHVSRARL
jgi:tetratricopeptide (TPR) repeat protein